MNNIPEETQLPAKRTRDELENQMGKPKDIQTGVAPISDITEDTTRSHSKKLRTLKVIPPKEPNKIEQEPFTLTLNGSSTQTTAPTKSLTAQVSETTSVPNQTHPIPPVKLSKPESTKDHKLLDSTVKLEHTGANTTEPIKKLDDSTPRAIPKIIFSTAKTSDNNQSGKNQGKSSPIKIVKVENQPTLPKAERVPGELHQNSNIKLNTVDSNAKNASPVTVPISPTKSNSSLNVPIVPKLITQKNNSSSLQVPTISITPSSPIVSTSPEKPTTTIDVIDKLAKNQEKKDHIETNASTVDNDVKMEETPTVPENTATNVVPETAKKTEDNIVANKIEVFLSKMNLDIKKSEMLALIEEAKLKQQNKQGRESIIVNDSRLNKTDHPNWDTFLGHVIYTGAKSRTAHSNRAVDLELFLCPRFTEKDHYATIDIRIPAEFLTYRGNIAVRKSAVWGTDVYTDDSDVVAMIIHSGHYRPVDAPDPVLENPDSGSLKQASLLKDVDNVHNRTTSLVTNVSPICSKVNPVIAQVDQRNSSSTVLLPDHDLNVTLRILPKLVKYTGSTRYGLDSKGWGSSHDGESVRIEKVTMLDSGSVYRLGRKSTSKKWGNLTLSKGNSQTRTFTFTKDGIACTHYTPETMNNWPTYLTNSTSTNGERNYTIEDFSLEELQAMKHLPYWRVRLQKYKCYLEYSNEKR
ncbi:histone deacetylation protein Rxt3-domain-containing protein [Globomyces pollinis-pini]|nr:histone deacetylation protein Rxt3-domain-containing protein [Globomyces pollinis-pini]